ncbi:hypothetical protein [uncultured Mailhella sp.]|uniref:hypothetical protein n=1 Tax=uncultured Mailhella sp. TaxID=1981031 RepID=UPI0026035E68|nr:hypothetical protein [uncultured Mailhella sp.]
MSLDTVIDLGKACGREWSEAEKARLREIGNSLNLRKDAPEGRRTLAVAGRDGISARLLAIMQQSPSGRGEALSA